MTTNRPPSCDQLPTKPGPYYWRESDGDEFQLVTVELHIYNQNPDVVHLSCYSGKEMRMLPIKDLQGQWLPIPTAEELVELQACKFELQNIVKANAKEWGMPNDEFMYEFHAWAVNRAKNVLGIYRGEHGTIIRKAKR